MKLKRWGALLCHWTIAICIQITSTSKLLAKAQDINRENSYGFHGKYHLHKRFLIENGKIYREQKDEMNNKYEPVKQEISAINLRYYPLQYENTKENDLERMERNHKFMTKAMDSLQKNRGNTRHRHKGTHQFKRDIIPCDMDKLVTFLARLQAINPESVVNLASDADVNALCNRVKDGLTDWDAYLRTCDPPHQKDLYLQLAEGVRTLNTKLCSNKEFHKEFMTYSSCFSQLHSEYTACVGPADWAENPDPKEVCKAYHEIEVCYFTKTTVLCGEEAAKLMKSLLQDVIKSVLTVQCEAETMVSQTPGNVQAGVPGLPGAPSIPGPPGIVPGTSGVPAASGVPGLPGVPGPSGIPGSPSVPGAAGIAGLPGAPLSPGVPGLPGAPLSPGVPGSQSVPGSPGVPGASGIPDSGVPYIPKTSGVPGTPVLSGAGIPAASSATGTSGIPQGSGLPGSPGLPGAPNVPSGLGAPIVPGTPVEAVMPSLPDQPSVGSPSAEQPKSPSEPLATGSNVQSSAKRLGGSAKELKFVVFFFFFLSVMSKILTYTLVR